MKISSYCTFKNSQKKKTPGGKNFFIISSYSKTKNMPKIAEVKLSSCGLEVAGFRKNCDCGVAVAEQHFFKKLQNCDCGLKKKLRVPTSGKLLNHIRQQGSRLCLWPLIFPSESVFLKMIIALSVYDL
jgi:hypothetical protein